LKQYCSEFNTILGITAKFIKICRTKLVITVVDNDGIKAEINFDTLVLSGVIVHLKNVRNIVVELME